jgi:hypothetical protein
MCWWAVTPESGHSGLDKYCDIRHFAGAASRNIALYFCGLFYRFDGIFLEILEFLERNPVIVIKALHVRAMGGESRRF